MPILCLFNHKGGVSKTTTTYHLGWMLANKGFKTLIVDTDPQCNLTSLVENEDKIEKIFNEKIPADLYSCVEPLEQGKIGGIKKPTPIETQKENLFIMYGNILLSQFENQLAFALTASKGVPAVRNLPGSLGKVLRNTMEEQSFDYVLVDMSPSVGALNQCILMGSDYFMVPTAPDYFCMKAIESLAMVLPSWNIKSEEFKDENLNYPFPDTPPKFIGFISQKYRPINKGPAASFRKWISDIDNCVENKLVPALNECNMIAHLDGKEHLFEDGAPYNIVNISDFNSLVALSQAHKTPVFSLTEEQLNKTGSVKNTMAANRDNFYKVFEKFTDSVVGLTQER